MSEIKRQLCQHDGSPLDPSLVLLALQGIIEGNFDAAPRPSGRIIDCDVAPFIPDGWRIDLKDQLLNVVRGQVAVEDIKFHLDESQKMGTIVGNDLKPKLADLPVLGVQALDYFLANTGIIPEAWKTVERIFFWGTIYRYSDGLAYVRYLYWRGGRWFWDCLWLDRGFDDQCPAAVLEQV
jgi:hypothetical protein